MSKTYTTTTSTTTAYNGPTNRPFLDQVDSSFARLFIELEDNLLMDTSLASKCLSIYDGVLKISNFAHEYNFSGINANGYWTFLKSCQKLADICADKLRHNYSIDEDTIQSMDDMTEGYLRILKHILAIRDMTKDDANCSLLKDDNCNKTNRTHNNNILTLSKRSQVKACKSLFVPQSVYPIDIVSETTASQVQLTSLMSNYGVFWLCKSLRYFFEVYMLAVAFFGTNFPISLKCLWSREYRIKAFIQWIQYPSLSYPFDIWDILDYKLVSKMIIPMLFVGRGVRANSVNIPRQCKYKFTDDGKDVARMNTYLTSISPVENSNSIINNDKDVTQKYVKCRLIKGKSTANSGKILFHCHGGGWLTHSPDSHENYLRQWASDMPDLTILSVAYSLKQHHPIALQEVLDVYLWLTSGKPEVIEMIGFEPSTVVLAGDSAGANLVVSLAMSLNHIRSKYSTNEIILPHGIVSIYGAFLLTPAAGPSRAIGYLDPLLSPGVLLTCGGVYGNLVDANQASPSESNSVCFPNWDTYESLLVNVKKFLLASYSLVSSFITPSHKPWFICEKKSLDKKMNTLNDRMNSPFCSPLLFNNFEALKNVKMHLVASEFCPLLDESVTMAKLWQGPVDMDVVPDLPHGFLNFTLVSPECQKGARLCGDRIRKVFDECLKL